jgi:arylsulfatase
VFNRPYSIEADLEIPQNGAEGVLLAQGGDAGGYTLFVADSRPRFSYNYVVRDPFKADVISPRICPSRNVVVVTGRKPLGQHDRQPATTQLPHAARTGASRLSAPCP